MSVFHCVWIHNLFDNVMMKLMFDHKTDAVKAGINLLNLTIYIKSAEC